MANITFGMNRFERFLVHAFGIDYNNVKTFFLGFGAVVGFVPLCWIAGIGIIKVFPHLIIDNNPFYSYMFLDETFWGFCTLFVLFWICTGINYLWEKWKLSKDKP